VGVPETGSGRHAAGAGGATGALVARVGDYLADVDAPAFPGRSPGKAVRGVMTALAGRLGRLG
jgi:hypothetical protein